ncbi:dihydrofolate reductase family protein [Haematomicrobium sanguinis]|uniref:dihydrofolate reductase family protein n=1 Tax=Haematomicrobium sanguinis TaxID=479106 RepID=UPI0006907C6B|nr:dihydrofolate reductase family protein [Haematomicrobium sanguinis]
MEELTPGKALSSAQIEANYAYPEDLPAGTAWLRFNFVSSLDGIAAFDGHAGPLGSPTDQEVMQVLRRSADAIIVGAGTIRAEGYVGALVEREDPPLVVVLSRTLTLEPSSDFFTQAPRRPLLVTTDSAAASRGDQFREVADVLPLSADGSENTVDITALIDYLKDRGLTKLLSEGGPHVFGAFAAQGLADELCLTLSPHLALTDATRITAGAVSEQLSPFTLKSALVENSMLFLRYWKD